jgi:hypothetical protein
VLGDGLVEEINHIFQTKRANRRFLDSLFGLRFQVVSNWW